MTKDIHLLTRAIIIGVVTVPVAWAVSAVTVSRTTLDGRSAVVMENPTLRIMVFPDLGGRIGSFTYKPTGKNLVYWDLSKHSEFGGLGGALDDKRTTFTPHTLEILKTNDGEAQIRLTGGRDPAIRKTFTLFSRGSALRVDCEFINAGQTAIGEDSMVLRNFILPSGTGFGDQDFYCIPSTTAVRRFGSSAGSEFPEFRTQYHDKIGAPWQALASAKDRLALCVVHERSRLNSVYWWFSEGGGCRYPTLEWAYSALPAGHRTRSQFWITVASGFDGVIDATRHYTADIKKMVSGSAVTLRLAFASVREDLKAVTVETEFATPGGKAFALPPVRLGDIAVGQVKNATLTWTLPDANVYIVRQTFFTAGTKLGEYQEPLQPERAAPAWRRTLAVEAPFAIEPIPGWKPLTAPVVKATAADRERGYMVYQDEFAPSPADWGKNVSAVRLDMGIDEYESCSVSCLPFKDLGTVTVTARGTVPVQVRIEERVNVGNKDWAKPVLWGRKLVAKDKFLARPDQPVVLWLTVDSRDQRPGTYPLTVALTPQKGSALTFTVQATIWPVRYPERPLVSLEAEHLFQNLPGVMKGGQWDLATAERYAQDLVQHRTTFFQLYGQLPLVAHTAGGRRDFSAYDPLVDVAVGAGLRSFSTNALLMNSPGDPIYFQDLYAYIRSRGFPAARTYCKILDEVPPSAFPGLVSLARQARKAGWKTYSTFHTQLASPELMKVLNPAFDMYQGGYTTPADYRARLAEGLVDPADEVWRYDGWGACWWPYADVIGRLWTAAYLNLDGFHIHVYYRSQLGDALIFPNEQGPVASAAWEGTRDGMEAVTYYRLAQYQVDRLLDHSTADARGRAAMVARELKKVCGRNSDSLLRFGETVMDLRARYTTLSPTMLPQFQAAKRRLLELLTILAPYRDQIPADLYWGDQALVENGKSRVALVYAGTETQARWMADRLEREFHVRLPVFADTQYARAANRDLGAIWLLTTKEHAAGLDRADKRAVPDGRDGRLGPGQYVVRELSESGKGGALRLAILGGNADGLHRGAENFVAFLSPYHLRPLLVKWAASD